MRPAAIFMRFRCQTPVQPLQVKILPDQQVHHRRSGICKICVLAAFDQHALAVPILCRYAMAGTKECNFHDEGLNS